jgi:hypothetical protein
MRSRPSIEDAKWLQRTLELGHTHLVWLDEGGFVIAHTDDERRKAETRPLYLETCPLHWWLTYSTERPVSATGWYTVEMDKEPPITVKPLQVA